MQMVARTAAAAIGSGRLRVVAMKRERPVVAIDGPVGAGKSTVARALAQALGFSYLNTGAMYRAVAVAARAARLSPEAPGAMEEGGAGTPGAQAAGSSDAAGGGIAGTRAAASSGAVDEGAAGAPASVDEEAAAGLAEAAVEWRKHLREILDRLAITFNGERIKLDGRDITDIITQPEIGDLASRFSAIGMVRDKLRDLQRAAGAAGGVVMEGRDIGTAIFPDAEVKFFLTAEPAVRAARRHAELAAKGVATTLAEVAAQLATRDGRDAGRALAPLTQAADAIAIDSTGRDVDAVVNEMKMRVLAVSRESGA